MAMGASLIVACLAVASLQAVRVQRRVNQEASQRTNANKLAEAGIESARQIIASDPDWRSKFTHGVAVTRNATGGTFSITLTDPTDGNIANRSTDPVYVTSTGNAGSATQKWMAYLNPEQELLAACQSSLYSPKEISFHQCTLNANQWVYCDDLIKSAASTIHANCMAGNSMTGNGYSRRAILGGQWPMDKPELIPTAANYIGNTYLANAQPINAIDLPTGGEELIANGGFETNISQWTRFNCNISRDTVQKYSGAASCLVSSQGFSSTPAQDITAHMIKGRRYRVSFWIRTIEDQDIYPTISFTGTGSGVPVVRMGAAVRAIANQWTEVTTTLEAAWSGSLVRAEFQIESEMNSNYHFDDVSIIDDDRRVDHRYIENVVLGSGNNPYGARVVSSNGVYSINMVTKKLVIRNCRINGTLVVQDADTVELEGGISWEPNGRNFPALIAQGIVYDLTTATTLSESTLGVNLNPASSPHLGVSDTDANDTYPSVISGAIIGSKDIVLDGSSTLSGPVMTPEIINVTASNLNINFQSDMILNPPPGFFVDPPKMRLIPSSVQTVQ